MLRLKKPRPPTRRIELGRHRWQGGTDEVHVRREIRPRILKAAGAKLDVQVPGKAELETSYLRRGKAEIATDLSCCLRYGSKHHGPANGIESPVAQMAHPAAARRQSHPVRRSVPARVGETCIAESHVWRSAHIVEPPSTVEDGMGDEHVCGLVLEESHQGGEVFAQRSDEDFDQVELILL